MTKEADQLLRILANPELFRQAGDHTRKPKRKLGNQDSVSALVAGMFRITGSVAASATIDNKSDDDHEVVNKDCSDTAKLPQTQSSTLTMPKPLSASVP